MSALAPCAQHSSRCPPLSLASHLSACQRGCRYHLTLPRLYSTYRTRWPQCLWQQLQALASSPSALFASISPPAARKLSTSSSRVTRLCAHLSAAVVPLTYLRCHLQDRQPGPALPPQTGANMPLARRGKTIPYLLYAARLLSYHGALLTLPAYDPERTARLPTVTAEILARTRRTAAPGVAVNWRPTNEATWKRFVIRNTPRWICADGVHAQPMQLVQPAQPAQPA